ncbi:MAG: acetyl-CoA decarbonylase/synthase complex subunit delta, partial [Oscillospiraceae bacterium]
KITVGGENVLPFYTFDAPIENMPKIGVEICDAGVAEEVEGIKSFYAGCNTVAEMAKKAETMPGADFIAIRFENADPNGANSSVEDCVKIAKEVSEATDMPLAFMGCKNAEKDAQIFTAVADALQGKNIVVLSAREEDYKTVAASAGLAYGQKVGAESAVDINLAKQLNVLISQLGVTSSNVVMNLGSAAGYGYEYVASTMDRVKAAALAQNDAMLQMPVITPVSTESWSVKEAMASEEDMPEWGSRETRGIDMEVITAAACLASGSNAVILKHPQSVETISKLIKELA